MVDFEELGWAALDWALAVLFGVVALVAAVFSPAAPAMFVGLVGAALVIVCARPCGAESRKSSGSRSTASRSSLSAGPCRR